jgi:CheY-like chemotaxis protein
VLKRETPVSHIMFKTTIVLSVCLCLLTGSTFAQDPFGGSADPFGGAGDTSSRDTGTTPTPTKPKSEEAIESDPIVIAIINSNPTSTTELGRAIRNVVNLNRPDVAKKYIAKLLDSSPDQSTLVELHRQLGSAMFMRMTRDERFAPEGPEIGKAVLDAAHAAAHDPAHLADLIRRLSDDDPAFRHAALVDLRGGGTDAVIALINVLADGARKSEHPVVRSALVGLKELSVGPLVGALETDDKALLPQVIVVLSRLHTANIAPHLLRPYFTNQSDSLVQKAAEFGLQKLLGGLPTRREAERYLVRATNEYLDGKLIGRLDAEDMITFWSWDATKNAPIQQRLPGRIASLMMAERLANDLYAIAPDNIDHQRLYLTALLESAKRIGGLELPLAADKGSAHETAAALGVDAVADALAFSLKRDETAAATGAIEILGAIGDKSLLQGDRGQLSTLAACLKHANRRVRFAALETIMKLDPIDAFAGSSYCSEVLGYFSSTVGSRRVLVAHPRTDQAQTLAGMLNEMGFEADTAQTGNQALRLATKHPDYEFILVSDAVDYPAVSELIQQLRRNPLTAMLPIGLMARQERFDEMQMITAADPLAETFPRPHDEVGVSLAARRLLDRAGDNFASFEERTMHASLALDHLARLAKESGTYSFYDLLRTEAAVTQAMSTPELTDQAARVLGLFGTPTAQRSLVTLASQNARRLKERQVAAKAFSMAISRRGLLLARNEILLQYDRYNQSKVLDRETQRVLSSLLDAIELPTRPSSDQGAANAAGVE